MKTSDAAASDIIALSTEIHALQREPPPPPPGMDAAAAAANELVDLSKKLNSLQRGSSNAGEKSRIVATLAKKLSFERKSQRAKARSTTTETPAQTTGTVSGLVRKLSFGRSRGTTKASSSPAPAPASVSPTAEQPPTKKFTLVSRLSFDRKPRRSSSGESQPPVARIAHQDEEICRLRAALERETARADAAEQEVQRLQALLDRV